MTAEILFLLLIEPGDTRTNDEDFDVSAGQLAR
jgi:hypothetical protein